VKRQARKKVEMGPRHPDRNAQFQNIARWKRECLDAGQPVLSIDAKKKELLGNFHRAGKLYTRRAIEVFDHDFPTSAGGVVFPHVTRACQGVVFHTVRIVQRLMEKTTTRGASGGDGSIAADRCDRTRPGGRFGRF